MFGDTKEPDQPLTQANVTFVKTDVTDYASVLALFRAAWDAHGRIDHAVSNAGLVEIGQLFTPPTGDDDAAIEEAPPTLVLDVNLKGTIFFTRIAVHFLRKSLKLHGLREQPDASILLVSSAAGFGGFPGLFQYSATKHGVYGLFRSSHKLLSSAEGIRMNAIMPNITRTLPTARSWPSDKRLMWLIHHRVGTQMVKTVIDLYESHGIPYNEPIDVANTMIYALSTEADGEALYIAGSKTYEIEKKLEQFSPDWLGEGVYQQLMAGQAALGNVRDPVPMLP